ncbi:MAG: metalloregulator ArsR/SmtB family transcription factor [Pseudomonadota bacterium]
MNDDDNTLVSQLSALAQSTRLRAFKTLIRSGADGMAAGQLASSLDVAPNTLSAHLNILQRSGLIRHRRDGRSVIYSVEIEEVSSMIEALAADCCAGYPDAAAAEALAKPLAC